jgi:uncharacterized protein (TIGR02300 family)
LTGRDERGKRLRLRKRISGTPVPKIDLGEKQTCPHCGAKFYDMKRRPAVCPKCQTSFDPADEVVRARRAKSRAGAFPPPGDDDEEAAEAEEAVETVAEEDEEETVVEAEVVDDEPPVVTLDDDEEEEVAEDELAEGFSEADVEVEEGEDDGVPFLEEEDDEFEEEIVDIGGDDDDR